MIDIYICFYFYNEESLYKVTGNVIITNHAKNEVMKTEELFWKPDEQRLYTDKFVRIETPKEILEGKYDHLPEDAFRLVGSIAEVIKKAESMK